MNKTKLSGITIALLAHLTPAAKAQTWAHIYTGPVETYGGKESIVKQSVDVSSIKEHGGKAYFIRSACHYEVQNGAPSRLMFCSGRESSPERSAEVFDCKKGIFHYDNSSPNLYKVRLQNGEWWGKYELKIGRRLGTLSDPKDRDQYYESIYKLVCGQ